MKSILIIAIFLSLVVSGAAQTRNVVAGTNGAVVSPTNFWSADASNARTGLGLGTAATNPASAFQPSSLALSNLVSSNGGALTNLTAANITGTLAISNGGSGATTAGGARTNFGLGVTNSVSFSNIAASGYISIGNSAPLLKSEAAGIVGFYNNVNNEYILSIPNDTDDVIINAQWNNAGVRSNLGLGASNTVRFDAIWLQAPVGGMSNSITYWIDGIEFKTAGETYFQTEFGYGIMFYKPIGFSATSNAAITRTNLSLGWSALTNTNPAGFNTSLYGSGTNPVLYNTNGDVVSPTNFWQVAPIVTRFVEFDPATNATTNIVAARNLHIHSLAISRTGVTSTIALPITNSFNGDIALVVHQGPTSSVTAVRTVGAATNLVTLNQFEQTVEFVFYDNVWQFNHNLSFIEPIFFSGTNAAANAGASRTNLGLGSTNNVIFNQVGASDVAADDITVEGAIYFTEVLTNLAVTRTNLGLPLAALTSTNNATFQEAVFTTNAAPTNGANFGDRVGWMGVSMVTNGVTNVFRIPIYK